MLSKHFSVFLFFIVTAFSSSVRADGFCTEAELDALGFKLAPVTDESLRRLCASTNAIRKVMKSNIAKTGDSHRTYLANRIAAALTKANITGAGVPCLKCFAASGQCVLLNCKAQCLTDEYSKACVRCIDEHCHGKFVACVGMETINPADHKDVLSKCKA
ncbi:uncharacterized protein BXIN_1839 [Babesia sp. Xinjiang]|uniref:uncharacterized protein n=1 Tax=Babesia sp. Xinjiang TaxID=462227 RepID=UPI000A258D16|nr:uncharacterized protein BXIN_1839 [Babesia sp. Xinjiang]ORM40501.1 hypothetical protein BXIN_1839 [Babesia sp. Xinjiang]